MSGHIDRFSELNEQLEQLDVGLLLDRIGLQHVLSRAPTAEEFTPSLQAEARVIMEAAERRSRLRRQTYLHIVQLLKRKRET